MNYLSVWLCVWDKPPAAAAAIGCLRFVWVWLVLCSRFPIPSLSILGCSVLCHVWWLCVVHNSLPATDPCYVTRTCQTSPGQIPKRLQSSRSSQLVSQWVAVSKTAELRRPVNYCVLGIRNTHNTLVALALALSSTDLPVFAFAPRVS